MSSRTVLITGAAGALGRVVAERFRQKGDDLALLDQIEPDQAAGYVGCCDLRDPDACQVEISRILDRYGRIDVLLNIAGGFEMGEPVYATKRGTWKFMFDVNLWTMLHMLEAVVPVMCEQGEGKIVNMGARAALKGSALMGAYAASKSAVVRLTESLADELKEEDINVNCILPSIIDTPRNRADMPNEDYSRWVSPERIADVMEFLTSSAAEAMHGASIAVDGRA